MTAPRPSRPWSSPGLTALAYIDDNGNRPRIAWSFRADSMHAPRKACPEGRPRHSVRVGRRDVRAIDTVAWTETLGCRAQGASLGTEGPKC